MWTNAIYAEDSEFALLLALDTNFQLSVYTNAMELIMTNPEYYEAPKAAHVSDNTAIFVENIKRISHLCTLIEFYTAMQIR